MESKLNIYYVAAKGNNASLLTRIMAYGGAITVERTWRSKERMSLIKRRKPDDTEKH
jgi:hypothetical protein